MFKNDKVEYINDVFVKLVDRLLIANSDYLNGQPSIEEMCNIRFLTIYREHPDSQDHDENPISHSLNEVLKLSQGYLDDKIFKLNVS